MPRIPRNYRETERLTFPDINSVFGMLRWLRERISFVAEPPTWAKTPAGGIPAGATGTAMCLRCTRDVDGTMIDGTAEIPVFNSPTFGAVAGATYILVIQANGRWSPILEPC
jgi:hypothetical protein